MNFFDSLGSIPGFLDRFSLVMVAGLLGMLTIVLVWSKLPGPKITKNKRRVEVTDNLRRPINLLIWFLYIALSAISVILAFGIFSLIKLFKGF